MRGTLLTSLGDVTFQVAWFNNLSATTAPGVNDDVTKGYSVGSQWIDVESQTSYLCYDATEGAAVWGTESQQDGLKPQGAPAAKTVSGTMTAANLLTGIITVNQGAGAASAQQLPLAADLDAALPQAVTNSSFDFSVINTSTVDAEDASVTTNTGWSLVGSMDVQAHSSLAAQGSSARFRARKTGAGAWTLYRIA